MEEREKEERLKEKSLKFSFWDGVFASGMTGFTQDYFTPFCLAIGATVKQIGFLSALPNLFSSLIQLETPNLVEKTGNRKKIILIFVFLQALVLLPMMILALRRGGRPELFIGMVTLFAAFGAFATPAWGSLMSDLVSPQKRGDYFGWRNSVMGFLTIIASFSAGFILHRTKKLNVFYGFALLFGLAMIFRFVSWYFLKRQYEPRLKIESKDSFTLFEFLARVKQSNFARFVLFVSVMSFAVHIAAPFFAVLMLKDLKFNYLLYTALNISATVATLASLRRWGRHADKVGNMKIIKFTSRLVGIIPLLWVVSQSPYWLFFAQLFSGFVWSGFNLAASNFIYDACSAPKRTRCIAYFNVLHGIFLAGGAILGGFLAQHLPKIFEYRILSVIFLSGILRLCVAYFLPFHLHEVRPVEKVKSVDLFFSMIGIKPIIGNVDRKAMRQ